MISQKTTDCVQETTSEQTTGPSVQQAQRPVRRDEDELEGGCSEVLVVVIDSVENVGNKLRSD